MPDLLPFSRTLVTGSSGGIGKARASYIKIVLTGHTKYPLPSDPELDFHINNTGLERQFVSTLERA